MRRIGHKTRGEVETVAYWRVCVPPKAIDVHSVWPNKTLPGPRYGPCVPMFGTQGNLDASLHG